MGSFSPCPVLDPDCRDWGDVRLLTYLLTPIRQLLFCRRRNAIVAKRFFTASGGLQFHKPPCLLRGIQHHPVDSRDWWPEGDLLPLQRLSADTLTPNSASASFA